MTHQAINGPPTLIKKLYRSTHPATRGLPIRELRKATKTTPGL